MAAPVVYGLGEAGGMRLRVRARSRCPGEGHVTSVGHFRPTVRTPHTAAGLSRVSSSGQVSAILQGAGQAESRNPLETTPPVSGEPTGGRAFPCATPQTKPRLAPPPRTSAQSPFLSLRVGSTDPARVSPGLRRCLLPPQPPGLRVAQGQGSRPGRASAHPGRLPASPSPSEPALLAPARGPRPPAWGSSPDPRGPVCQGARWALGGHSAMTRHLLTQPRAPSRDL